MNWHTIAVNISEQLRDRKRRTGCGKKIHPRKIHENFKKCIQLEHAEKRTHKKGKNTHMEKRNNLLTKQNLSHPHHFSNGPSLIILPNWSKHETKLNHLRSVHTFCHTLSRDIQWDNWTILEDSPRIEMGMGIRVEQLWNYNGIFYLLYKSELKFTSSVPDGFLVSEQQLLVSPNKPYHQDSELLPKQPAKKIQMHSYT